MIHKRRWKMTKAGYPARRQFLDLQLTCDHSQKHYTLYNIKHPIHHAYIYTIHYTHLHFTMFYKHSLTCSWPVTTHKATAAQHFREWSTTHCRSKLDPPPYPAMSHWLKPTLWDNQLGLRRQLSICTYLEMMDRVALSQLISAFAHKLWLKTKAGSIKPKHSHIKVEQNTGI